MKKLRNAFIVLIAVFMLAFFVGCTRIAPLNTPKGFNFDENFNMYWSYVPGARSYILDIKGVESGYQEEKTTHVTHVSLEYLKEGDYNIRVMAVGGVNNAAASPWSEIVPFHRDSESGLVFQLINGNTEYAVKGIGSASGDIVIEDTHRGKPVTAILEDAFRGKGNSRVESVTIGANVKTIGDNAFYNCTNLKSVVIPDSVTSIGANLFQGCSSLETVAFPDTLTSIPAYTFAYCRSLEAFTIGEKVTSIGESAFYNCSALKAIDVPDSVTYVGPYAFDSDTALASLTFGSKISAISEYAFYNCSALESVTFAQLDESVELSLGEHAFDGCSAIKSVKLPDGLTAIGGYSFYRCSALAAANIPDTVTSVGAFAFRDTAIFFEQGELHDDGYIYTKQGHDGFIYVDKWIVAATDELKAAVEVIEAEDMRGVVGIADQTFVANVTSESGAVTTVGAPSLVDVTIAKSVKYIGVYSFYKCQSLRRFVAETGSQLVSIGERAFQDCENLSSIQFRNGLRDIGSYAFYRCDMLASRDGLIPDSVDRIGTYAFYGTAMWDDAQYTDGIVYADDWVVGFNSKLDDVNAKKSLKFKSGVYGVSDFAFYNNTDIETIEGLSSARRIGRGAFFGCANLSLITLNDSLTEIADNTFSGCSQLFVANLPIGLQRIGLRAFYGCTLLDKIDLSETRVSEIGALAFYGCYNVKSLTLGSNVEIIGERAFYGLSQITELTVPNKVKQIGTYAFANCEALERVDFGTSLEVIGSGAFQGCSALTSVYLPDSVRYIGSYAFYLCPDLSQLHLGSGVELIGNYTFASNALTSVTLPASVKYIGAYAFKNCSLLSSVILLGTPVQIGIHAFYGDHALTVYAVAEGEGENWNTRWNSSYRPVVWGCTVGEGGYIASFTVSYETVSNPRARGGFSAPVREGYDFVGWALTEGGEAVYGADDWRNAEFGTTLYSVWAAHTDAAN